MLWDIVSGIAIGAVAGVVLLAIGTGVSRFYRWIDHINAAMIEINMIHHMLQEGERIRDRENRTNPRPRATDHQFDTGRLRDSIEPRDHLAIVFGDPLSSSITAARRSLEEVGRRLSSAHARIDSELDPISSSPSQKQAPSSPDLIEQSFQQVWHQHQMYSVEENHDRS